MQRTQEYPRARRRDSGSPTAKSRRALLGLVGAAALLLSAIPSGGAAAQDAPVTGTVDEVNLPSGAKAFVYVPDGIQLVAWTTPVLLVYGDDDFTASSAKTMAEASGLAANAKNDNAVITFVNSVGDEWGTADVTAFDQIVNRLYIERPNQSSWSNGRAPGVSNGRPDYPVIYQGYQHRIGIIANGSGADFVGTYLVDDLLTLSMSPPPASWLPANVMLFNTVAVPNASLREWPAIIINGSAEVNSKYASLNAQNSHRFYAGTSSITDDFDLAIVADRYQQLTSVRRQQLVVGQASQGAAINSVVIDIPDYDALGIAPEQVNLTLAPNRASMYLAFVPDSIDREQAGSVPLVMLFHGSGERAEWVAMHTHWPKVAAEEGFIVVSVDNQTGMSAAQIYELMDDVFARYPSVDRSRVYASGFSLGAGRSITLGTQRPDLFAGIAPLHTTANPVNATEDLVLPTIYFAGERDTFPSVFPRHTSANYTGTLNNADRTINHLYRINDIRGGAYTYDTTAANRFWGIVDFDDVETFPATHGFGVFTVNSLRSNDGNVYTKLVNVSDLNHNGFADQAPVAWEFLKQFSRNPDGTISIASPFDVETSTGARTLAGKAYLTVTVRNADEIPLNVVITTPFGTKSFTSVQPGKNASVSLNTLSASFPAGTATATISATVDGDLVTHTVAIPYGAYGG